MNLPPSMLKERIRLIKPSRPQAPTEYNLQYKKWPVRPFTYDTFRVVDTKKKKKLYDTIQIPKATSTTTSTGYPASSLSTCKLADGNGLETDFDSTMVQPPTNIDVLEEDYDINSVLRTKTAKFHQRPAPKQGSPKSKNRGEPTSKDSRKSLVSQVAKALNKKAAGSKPCSARNEHAAQLRTAIDQFNKKRMKEAWAGSSEDLSCQQQQKPTIQQVSRLSRNDSDLLRIRDLYCAIENVCPEEWNQRRSQNDDEDLLKSLPSEETVQNVRSDSVIQMKLFDTSPPGTPAIQAPRQNGKKQGRWSTGECRRSRPFSVDGVDGASLRKLYANLSPKDLRKLHDTYRGLIGPDKGRRDGKSELTQEDINALRQTAIRSASSPLRVRSSKEWNTSYKSDFRNWHAAQYKDDGSLDVSGEMQHATENTSTEAFASSEEKTDETEGSTQDENEEDEAELKIKKRAAEISEREKTIDEATKIEEAEYLALFNRDGKHRLQDQTSSSAFKAWPPRNPETPIWANKTVVSLGSNHWNLPLNKNECWELSDCRQEEKQEDKSHKSPPYKLRVYDPEEETSGQDSAKKKEVPAGGDAEQTDPFIAMYYPDRRTNSTYLTEYMRKFHRLPVQPRRKFL